MDASRILLGALLSLMLGQASAQGSSLSDPFQVRIGIVSTCTAIAADDIDFGNQTPGAGLTVSATGNLAVKCTNGQEYAIGLDQGQNFDESNSKRRMAGEGTFIPYVLSADASGSPDWGSDGDTRQSGIGTGIATARLHTVHAIATLSGDEPAGSYEDTVTATLYF